MRHLGLWTILTMAIISCADKNNEIVEQKLSECYQEKFVGETLDKADPIKYYERLETWSGNAVFSSVIPPFIDNFTLSVGASHSFVDRG